MYNYNSYTALIDERLKLKNKIKRKLIDEIKYQRFIKIFLYLWNFGRPNINFVVSNISKYCTLPQKPN